MYMGVVRLSSVKSYWKGVGKDNMYPVHKPCRHLSYPRYQMLWRCISLIPVDPEFLPDSDTEDDENEEEENEQEDEAMEEDDLEDNNALVGRCFFDPDDPDDVYLRIETVTDNEIVLILSTATGEPADAAGFDIDFVRAHLVSKRDQVAREMEIEREKARDKRWFKKCAPLLDHIKKINKDIFVPGNVNAVDEMMVRYFGRSGHTFRMRNKPIKEGFKVWGLSCSNTGFCYTFTPGSRQNTIDADDYTKT